MFVLIRFQWVPSEFDWLTWPHRFFQWSVNSCSTVWRSCRLGGRHWRCLPSGILLFEFMDCWCLKSLNVTHIICLCKRTRSLRFYIIVSCLHMHMHILKFFPHVQIFAAYVSERNSDIKEILLSSLFICTFFIPQKGPPRFLTEGHRNMTKSGLAFVYCVYCI